MKLDLCKFFKKSTLVQMPEITMAHQLAGYLLSADAGINSIKFYHFGEKLEEHGFIEVDEADRKALYDFIDKNKIGSGVKAQLLLEIDKIKEIK